MKLCYTRNNRYILTPNCFLWRNYGMHNEDYHHYSWKIKKALWHSALFESIVLCQYGGKHRTFTNIFKMKCTRKKTGFQISHNSKLLVLQNWTPTKTAKVSGVKWSQFTDTQQSSSCAIFLGQVGIPWLDTAHGQDDSLWRLKKNKIMRMLNIPWHHHHHHHLHHTHTTIPPSSQLEIFREQWGKGEWMWDQNWVKKVSEVLGMWEAAGKSLGTTVLDLEKVWEPLF